MDKKKLKALKLTANTLRQDVIQMLLAAGAGHTGGPLGMADVFANLYFNVAKHDPKKPHWEGRDRIVLSNGHICAILYASLAEAGYLPKEELKTFRKLDSRLQGHPARMDLPGVETSAGSLGQGIGVAVGMAMAAKLDSKPHTIFALMGDGELNEGSCWESFLNAHKFKLDNLLVMVDRNDIQIDGYGHVVLPLDPLADKFKAFGFDVFEADGNDMAQVVSMTEKAMKTKNQKPRVIIWKTIMGKGVDFMQNLPKWHGIPPNAEQAAEAMKQLQAERVRIEAEKA
ncbi:transketolase [Candidatus Micrarchaeota archaeon]|nr:transketolase [Candidatus Micrarchaeota archaeon]